MYNYMHVYMYIYVCMHMLHVKVVEKFPYALLQLHVFKPVTSKAGNSEQYVICIGYKGTVVLSQEHLKKMSRVYGNKLPYICTYIHQIL